MRKIFCLFTMLILFSGCALPGQIITTAGKIVDKVTVKDPVAQGQKLCNLTIIGEKEKQVISLSKQLLKNINAFCGRDLLVHKAVEAVAADLKIAGIPTDQKIIRKYKAGLAIILDSKYMILEANQAQRIHWLRKMLNSSLKCLTNQKD